MKIKKLSLLALLGLAVMGAEANASMLGLCNNNVGTQYICCPINKVAAWKVGTACINGDGALSFCRNDTGVIAATGIPILQDCKNRGGSSVSYPF